MRYSSVVRISLGLLLATGIAGAGFAYTFFLHSNVDVPATVETVQPVVVVPSLATDTEAPSPEVAGVAVSAPEFAAPITRANERVLKKPFGLHIDDPAHSPVPNDRFEGFHVGVDFETFPDEQDVDVPIVALCSGPLLFKKYATGYGGMAAQGCIIDGKDVTIIYGHLALSRIALEPGTDLQPGDHIGFLGQGYSEETDGVRKHLHLGIREGRTTDIRGYVQDAAEIAKWLDPMVYLP